MPSSIAQSSTEVHSAPDWEMKAMCPLVGVVAAKLALRWMPGTISPRQFGPRIRMPLNLCCSSTHRLFELLAFLADFAEAGRDDHDAPGAGLAAATDDARHGRGRRADDRQIGIVRQTLDVLVGLDALNRFSLRIDRIDHAAEARADQVPQHGVADAGGRVAGPDDGDAGRGENLIEVLDTHGWLLAGVGKATGKTNSRRRWCESITIIGCRNARKDGGLGYRDRSQRS